MGATTMSGLPADLEADIARIGGEIKGGVSYQKSRTGESEGLKAATESVSHLKDEKAATDMEQVRLYMEMTTGEKWKSDDMWESLKDGTMLCKFINALSPGAVRKINRPGLPFKEMENITFFLEAAVKFGLRANNTFRTPDLYEKRVSYPKAIVDCILAVKRVAAKGAVKEFSAKSKWGEGPVGGGDHRKEGMVVSGDTDKKSRGMSKAMAEATAAVADMNEAQEAADFQAAKDWLEAVSGVPWSGDDLWENTKDGILLCNVVNKIRPGGVAKINRAGAPFKEMENLTNFIAACKALGVRESDTFRPPDLYEKRVSYPKAIINCIHALGKASKKAKTFSGPYLEVEKVQDRKY